MVGVIKDICCFKGEGTVDHITVTRWFNKFHLGCKTLTIRQDQIELKTTDSKAVLLAIEAISVSGTQRVSGELSIS